MPLRYSRPYGGDNIQLPGLAKGTIPIFPSHKMFAIGSQSKKKMIDRWQCALTKAYAFTNYESQGQTIECVIVDISKPPSGSLLGFNVYVALPRSQGHHLIHLL